MHHADAWGPKIGGTFETVLDGRREMALFRPEQVAEFGHNTHMLWA